MVRPVVEDIMSRHRVTALLLCPLALSSCAGAAREPRHAADAGTPAAALRTPAPTPEAVPPPSAATSPVSSEPVPRGSLGPEPEVAATTPGAVDGLWCEVSVPDSQPSGHSVFFIAFLRQRGGRLREVFRVPHQARSLDFPEAIYATLRASYADATGVLSLTDGAFPCARAVQDTDMDNRAYRRVVDRVCSARGTYRWTGSTFRRLYRAPRLVWPAHATAEGVPTVTAPSQ
jgi:hypothetical protein